MDDEEDKEYSPFYNRNTIGLFQSLFYPTLTLQLFLRKHKLIGFSCNDTISFVQKNPIPQLQHPIFNSIPKKTPIETQVARKIRIYPSLEQRDYLAKCFGTTRFLYNRMLDQMKASYADDKKELNQARENGCIIFVEQELKKGQKEADIRQCGKELETEYFCHEHANSTIIYSDPLSFQHWRNKIIVNNRDLSEDEKWLAEIPYDTRQLVIKNLVANYKSCITNLKNGHIKSFNIKFKSRKDKKQFCFVDHRALNSEIKLWPRKFNYPLKISKRDDEWLKSYIKIYEDAKERSDMIITREYPGRYYLHVPYITAPIDIVALMKAVGIDPGVRAFHNFYDSKGNTGKIGVGVADKLLAIEKQIDNLKSRITHTNTSENDDGYRKNKMRRQNMRRKCAWLRTKIRNIMDDFHWKSASFYCKNYETIIIPKMDTESLKKKIRERYWFNKELKGDNIRKLMSLAHNRFVDRLLSKAQQYGRKVIIQDEAYTSQTCGKCGLLNKNLGPLTEYRCLDRECRGEIDRDINGARNIMIRGLEQYTIMLREQLAQEAIEI